MIDKFLFIIEIQGIAGKNKYYYYMLKDIDDHSIHILSLTQGIIAPHSVSDVPLLIKANTLEEQEVPCLVQIFGSQDLPIVSSAELISYLILNAAKKISNAF